MKELIDVFRMTEIEPKTRARIIVQLGNAINYKFASNVTEGIVYELVSILDPDHEVLKDDCYLRFVKRKEL